MSDTETKTRALRAGLDRLNETDRRQATDLLSNISLYGAGFNQRRILDTLVGKVGFGFPAIA